MARILQSILMAFAGIDFIIGIRTALSWKTSRKDSKVFVFLAFSGMWWCIFFGLILIQTDPELAYLFRCLGLIGTFSFLILTIELFTIWSDLPKRLASAFKLFSHIIIPLFPFIIRRDIITFHETPYGLSYSLDNNLANILYNIYSALLGVIMLYMILKLLSKHNKKRIRSIGRFMLLALLSNIAGAISDTLMPMLGFAAIPGSTFTQFFGTLVLLYTITYISRTTLTVNSVSYQMFHTLKIPLLVYNDSRQLALMSDEARTDMGLGSMLGSFTQLNDIFTLDNNPLDSITDFASYATKTRDTGIDYELEISVLRDPYGDTNGYLAIAYNTSERMKFIAELEAERIRADRSNVAKTAFLANMSHEIRTPINTVLGMNEMIRRESDSATVSEYSANIKNSGEALLSIINDILDFSKVEAGMMEINESDYDLRLLLTGLIEMFSLKSVEKGLDFKLDIDSSLPRMLHGDEIRLRQVMINLLSNAVKYTGNGSITLSVQAIHSSSDIVRIRFSVTDTGIGIRQDNISTLFDSFTRFDSRNTKYIEGTGLGLSIVKNLASLMNAELKVESEYGKGSTFSFELDQGIAGDIIIGDMSNPDALSLAIEEKYHESFTAPEASVLIVDDNRMNLQVIKGLLKRTLIHIDTASSGQECLSKAAATKYHMILLDHMMPGMDGIETLKLLKEIPDANNASHNAVIIALTANAIYGAREMYLESGFTDYLSKPVDGVRLEACICKYLPKELVMISENNVNPNTAQSSNGFSTDSTASVSDNVQNNSVSSWQDELCAQYGINLSEALIHCSDMEIFTITAEAFIESVPQTVRDLAAFRQAGDIENYRILIHAVKSNAKTLGQTALFEYALSQEMSCKEGNFAPILEDGDKPEREVSRLSEGLQKLIASRSNPSDQVSSSDTAGSGEITPEITEQLQNCLTALEDFDDTAATETITALNEANIPEELRSALKSAHSKCRVYDYDGAIELIKPFLEQ